MTSGNAILSKASTASTATDTIGTIKLSDNLDITNAATGARLTISGNFTESGGAKSIAKFGAGTLTLSGTNNYTGTTNVFVGTLSLAKAASLYNGGTGNWTATKINVSSGAMISLNVGRG